ncbi:glycosyl hydrolase family 35, partial [Ancylostoma duodenale]
SEGPAVNSECYTGWYRTWGEKGIIEKEFTASVVLELTEKMYNLNASFNYYMFHGGTNFGFWNGAEYAAGLITSYDYFAPMTENGDYNDKYKAIRDFISGIKGWTHPPQDLPAKPKSFAQSGIVLSKIGNWFDFEQKTINPSRSVQGPVAKTFEDVCCAGYPLHVRDKMECLQLNQAMGFVKYSTKLSIGGSVLDGTGVRDFGYVFVNRQFKGMLSPHYKPHEVKQLKLALKKNDLLEILVENQGRLTWETANDYKGIISAVKLDGSQLTGWTSSPMDVQQLAFVSTSQTAATPFGVGDVFSGDFVASGKGDTFLDMSNWGKGVAWINGFNLGRYWSTAGPQKYLYVPAPLLTEGKNSLVFLELEKLSSDCKSSGSLLTCTINLLDHPLKYK